ncbi:hypothetical protein MUK72_16110 (plasmid) [Halococcus dombrowskii]|uniref:Uncharacterized protein n=1 Tax=Halococcus dombrowskii TaxID=179637 RepID=A0AAV3SH24_HALDO|nr:hypothetical protein [Halococcus dombrowskii]UOO96702.1 hypothetical protein MUK72_16110 [Halococcus dombrowskii]
MSMTELFRSDPTRQLEEVQKVNARERAATDVAEFHETESAKNVLSQLGETIEKHSGEAARFLYLHATFGSGKTHLLKLIGLVADSDSEFAHLGAKLAEQWPGFHNLAHSIEKSHVDRLKPVFLNLLDRDASKEPPLPFLIFEAIGRGFGYPTDPNWLLEWAWMTDMEYDGVWEELCSTEYDGQTFDDVLAERASLRRWLYEALPAIPETTGTELDSQEGVKASIERAEEGVNSESFDSSDLVDRVKKATEALNEEGTNTELLLGLDEVALFVGDSRHRYREFEETMEALQNGLNPVVVTTGQYSLPATRESLIGEPSEDHWTQQEVELEGTDTEIIVRKRWLQKDSAGSERVSSLISSMPDLSLETYASVDSADPDPVESYPFREYDLTLLRTVMQELITQGRSTEREYIQGRALLVLVRSLFTKFGWASAEEGALVTWDELFDLLVEETTYVPLWVQEMLENTLIPTFGGNEDAWEVRVSKALYLLNQTPAVPATPGNLGRLMFNDVEASVHDAVEETQTALNTLVDKQKVLTETNDHGDEVYTLVSEEQENILSQAQTKAEQISPHQLSAWLETRLRENESFFRSDGSRYEVDVGDERLVPLRYEYSILDPVDRAPTTEHDAIRIRVLADEPDTVADQVETWQEVNGGREGGEHILIAIDVAEATLDRIRNVIGMERVLDEETESHEELEREHRTDQRQLESSVSDLLENASVHTVHDYRGDRPNVLEQVVEDQVQSTFGSTRKVLSRPLVEVDDAKGLATFFQGSSDWPLADSDAVMLGVDRSTTAITDTGWCREFISEYESKSAVDVENILQQTRTANGDYRGTPKESIAALLITLATSNEKIALKQDTDYVTDPTAIGRQVRTKGGLTSLQVRFGVEIVNPKEVREIISTVLGHDPSGNDPDEWVAELGTWIAENSVLVKRTFKGVSREFDVSLDALEDVFSPAYGNGEIAISELTEDNIKSEAETFADARELFIVENRESTLWEQFTTTLDLLESLYPAARVTSQLQTTAGDNSVPTKSTVETRLSDAVDHRVDVLSTQYRRITGGATSASTPDEIRTEFTNWVCENESALKALLSDGEDTFKEISLDSLRSMLEDAWWNGEINEQQLVSATVRQQAKTYEKARDLLAGDPSPWSKLESAGDSLRSNHPESPTTDAVEAILGKSQPPSLQRVQRLIDEASDPIPPGDDDVRSDLLSVAEDLRQELPNAGITDEVTEAVADDDRPTDDQATDLLDEAETLLIRIRKIDDALDSVDDGNIVLIEE